MYHSSGDWALSEDPASDGPRVDVLHDLPKAGRRTQSAGASSSSGSGSCPYGSDLLDAATSEAVSGSRGT